MAKSYQVKYNGTVVVDTNPLVEEFFKLKQRIREYRVTYTGFDTGDARFALPIICRSQEEAEGYLDDTPQIKNFSPRIEVREVTEWQPIVLNNDEEK